MVKRCEDCHVKLLAKPNDKWHRLRFCTPCRKRRLRETSAKYRATRTPEQQAARWMVYKYGIDYDEYVAIFLKQEGRCAVCRTALVEYRRGLGTGVLPHVDHDHATGRVRGLLCGGCNRGIGQFKENANTLRQAADYLESFL